MFQLGNPVRLLGNYHSGRQAAQWHLALPTRPNTGIQRRPFLYINNLKYVLVQVDRSLSIASRTLANLSRHYLPGSGFRVGRRPWEDPISARD